MAGRRVIVLLASAVLSAQLAGCGAAPGTVEFDAGGPGAGPAEVDTRPGGPEHLAALASWLDFPADATPRPIVLISDTAGGGFTTDDAKLAAMAGNFELATTLPAGPATVAVELPGGPVTMPAISAEQAFTALRGNGSPTPTPQPTPTGAPPENLPPENLPPVATVPPLPAGTPALRITGVELGTSRFLTDRGELSLPVWRFSGPGVAGSIDWPALSDRSIWRWQRGALTVAHPELLPLGSATLRGDGSVVTVTLLRPKQPCPGMPSYRHEPVVTQTPTAVVVGTRRLVADPAGDVPDRPCPQDLGWDGEEHDIRLDQPLGSRVLIDEEGRPLTVTP